MSIRATVSCDDFCCPREVELDAMNSADVEVQHHNLEALGWFIDHENGFDYCPKCAPNVPKEMEQNDD